MKGRTYTVPSKAVQGRLSNGRYLCRMREYAAYRSIPRIHYERMVADNNEPFNPQAPPAPFL